MLRVAVKLRRNVASFPVFKLFDTLLSFMATMLQNKLFISSSNIQMHIRFHLLLRRLPSIPAIICDNV